MQKLIRFILKYNFIITFLILELFSISLLVQNNSYQRDIAIDKFQNISGFFYKRFNDVSGYFSLKRINNILIKENIDLKNSMLKLGLQEDSINIKSSAFEKFHLLPARVINNSVNKQNNYLIIEAGSKDGVKPDMAVLGPDGVVGIVISVSKNYASVIPLLNPKIGISGKIKKNEYFGILKWDGLNYRQSVLNEIPDFVDVQPGDTIVTSGYSTIFPQGELIGFVSGIKKLEGSGFWKINVELSTDFKKLYNIYVVKNINKEEIQSLEQETIDDNYINK
ncbi:rod shape-determining protein MreC [Bacteroidota bacterium]